MQCHVRQTGRELFQESQGCMKSTHTRLDRLADLIKREVSEILLREVKDPRVAMVTITHATVTSDLKQAKVFFSTMKPRPRKRALQPWKTSAGSLRQMAMR